MVASAFIDLTTQTDFALHCFLGELKKQQLPLEIS